MDLRTGESLWIDRNRELVWACAMLDAPAQCDVLIIGGGITGAIAADLLSEAGVDVMVIDKRDFGIGSTAASTALLMYEIDASLLELAERFGAERAARCYQLSLGALQSLASLAQSLSTPCDFAWRKCLYLASRKSHMRKMEAECKARRRAGIEVELLNASDIAQHFSFTEQSALLSQHAAVVDPVKLTHALLKRAAGRGARAVCRVCVQDIQQASGGMVIATENGMSIRAKIVVIAAGYESGAFLAKPPGSLHSSYVACSKPMPTSPLWHENWLIWETRRPYAYARTTSDRRAIIGGADVKFKNAAARDALLPRRTRALEKKFLEMFPDLKFETDYAWTGTFGDSADGLPYIGSVAERPGCLFAMGYGGNGITWSMLAAELIRDHIMGRTNRDAKLFSFDRHA